MKYCMEGIHKYGMDGYKNIITIHVYLFDLECIYFVFRDIYCECMRVQIIHLSNIINIIMAHQIKSNSMLSWP